MAKIEHFSHSHPLILDEVKEEHAHLCYACREPTSGSGSMYSCRKCNFWLHKSCAELPHELEHPLHKHALILGKEPYNLQGFDCVSCKKSCSNVFVYHCSLCQFDLDIKCASQPRTMKVESHDHMLSIVQKLIPFTCDACGKESTGTPYLCVDCGIWFHSECAFSPLTVKNTRHKHPLKLVYSLKIDQLESLDHRFCQLCVAKVDLNYWLYHCSICDFVAHLNCATDKRSRDDNFVVEYEDKGPIDESITESKYEDLELDKSIDSIPFIVRKTNLERGKVEIATEIKHFSHEHDLTLFAIDNLTKNQICDGCIGSIFAPFYNCAKCNFFLHRSCAKLPRKKQHPLHRHPLTLLAKAPYNFSTYFGCNACRRWSNGFTYNCHGCGFDLDVQCSLILDTHIHDCHKHPLILSNMINNVKCHGCDSEGNMFRCGTANCEFALDFKCITLPRLIRYEHHEHQFSLEYTAEDDSEEYYCDICEESRNQKHWFYYCKECSYPAHPRCIRGKYPNIKFEKTYSFDFHIHPLTFVEIGDYTRCGQCGDDCHDLHFECRVCDLNFRQRLPVFKENDERWFTSRLKEIADE